MKSTHKRVTSFISAALIIVFAMPIGSLYGLIFSKTLISCSGTAIIRSITIKV